jgi:hypothetical protein
MEAAATPAVPGTGDGPATPATPPEPSVWDTPAKGSPKTDDIKYKW